MSNHKLSLFDMSSLCWSFGSFRSIWATSSNAAHKENLLMSGLFPEFSMIWFAKAMLRPTRRAGRDLFAPFQTLHAIQWSAPWKAECNSRKEGFG